MTRLGIVNYIFYEAEKSCFLLIYGLLENICNANSQLIYSTKFQILDQEMAWSMFLLVPFTYIDQKI